MTAAKAWISPASIALALLALLGLVGTACDGDGEAPLTATPTRTATAITPTATLALDNATPATPSATAILPTAHPTEATTPIPTVSPSVVIRRIEGEQAVFLTFDAGADRGYTSEILDLLAEKGVRASFGLTGAWAAENPDIVRRIVEGGHTIINHSYDHPSFTGNSSTYVALSTDERLDQLARTEAIFASIAAGTTGVPYFRPPFGDYDDTVLRDVGDIGYRYTLMWRIDSGGWRELPVPEIVMRVGHATSGDIVIMHVASAGDYEALPVILEQWRSRGLATSTISDVLP